MKTILTNTSAATFRACPRKFRNRYVYRLARARQATALRFGSAFHLGMEVHGRGLPLLDPIAEATAGYEICPDWADPTEWAVERETLRQLLAGHFWRYSKDDLSYLAVEQSFEMPLVNPATGWSSHRFRLAGKIDGVVQLPDGRLAVLEYKTAGEDIGPSGEYWPRLRCDGQISLYLLAARSMGFDAAAVLYDVTRKPTIRLRKGETPEEYSQRLYEDIDDRPDYYYQRREIPRLEDELAEFKSELWQQAHAIGEATRHDRWYRSVSKITCGNCEFSQLCFNNARIDPATPPPGFAVLADPHPELSTIPEEVN